MAAYNGQPFITEQISSILNQKKVEIHLFISLDPSTDQTGEELARWAFKESKITLLSSKKKSGSAAQNFFRLLRDVNLDDFEYISFADQDDIWLPEKLYRAHLLLTERSAQGYSSSFTAFWPKGNKKYINKATHQKEFDYLFEGPGPGCTFVLLRSLALKLQYLVKNNANKLRLIDHHDWMIYAFARANNQLWVIDDWSSLFYRQHSHNQVGVNYGVTAFLFRAKAVLKGHGFQQSILIADVIKKYESKAVQFGLLNGRWGYIWLAFQAFNCRRKFSHQVLFFIASLIIAIINPNLKRYEK